MGTSSCLLSYVRWLFMYPGSVCTCVAVCVCVWSPGALVLIDLGAASMCVALGCLLESAGSSMS